MNRQRLLPTLAAIAAAFTVPACGLVPDADLAASVNDDHLTYDELDAIVQSSADIVDAAALAQGIPDPSSPDFKRLAITYWILDTALVAEAEDLGIDLPPLPENADAFAHLDRAAYIFDQIDVAKVDISDDALRAAWDNSICLVFVSGADSAVRPLLQQLEDGTPIDELVYSEQPADMSDYICFDSATIADQILQGNPNSPYAPIIDDFAASTPGTAHEPIVIPGLVDAETIIEGAYHPTFDQLTEAQVERHSAETTASAQQSPTADEDRQAQLNEIFTSNDIWVASAYGAFNPEQLAVIPLG